MTVYRERGHKTYRFDFWYGKRRYRGSTRQITLEDAQKAEDELKRQLRHQAGGIATLADTPRFTDWAAVYYAYASKRVSAPQHLHDLLKVVLRFWGAKPSGHNPRNPVVKGEPYHDLRLGDPIVNPQWILDYEDWLGKRPIGPQMRDHYRSIMSRMYRVALLPHYRHLSCVGTNPFAGVPRERPSGRTVILTPDQVRAWLAACSYHVRLAIAIAALAPQLRLRNVLDLAWDRHLSPALDYVTVTAHKTARKTGRPLVTPISGQLREILVDARQRHAGAFVVSYRGVPVRSIRHGLKEGAKRAQVHYGRDVNGATFHTLRHTASTLLAELGVQGFLHMAVMGHTDPSTTLKYTHLRPVPLKAPVEQLSTVLPLADLVTHARRRATKTPLATIPVKEQPDGHRSTREHHPEADRPTPLPPDHVEGTPPERVSGRGTHTGKSRAS